MFLRSSHLAQVREHDGVAAAASDLRDPRPLVPKVLHHAGSRVPALVTVPQLSGRVNNAETKKGNAGVSY